MIPVIVAVGVLGVLLFAASRRVLASTGNSSAHVPGGSSAPVPPVGLRNNNPTNVKGKGWQGQKGNDAQGHAIFDTLLNGLRAAAIDIHTGFVRDHEDTARKILMEWAGAEAPSIANYIAFVSNKLGVSPDQKLTYTTHIVPLLRAISEFELGSSAYRTWNPPDSLFTDAVKASGRA